MTFRVVVTVIHEKGQQREVEFRGSSGILLERPTGILVVFGADEHQVRAYFKAWNHVVVFEENP